LTEDRPGDAFKKRGKQHGADPCVAALQEPVRGGMGRQGSLREERPGIGIEDVAGAPRVAGDQYAVGAGLQRQGTGGLIASVPDGEAASRAFGRIGGVWVCT